MSNLAVRYGELLSNLQRDDPEAALIIRDYVAKLRTEAAAYRRETHRLRSALGQVTK